MVFTPEQVVSAFEKLPESLRVLVLSVDTFSKLKEIATGSGLSQNERETLGSETGYVLMGLIRPEEFESRLAERFTTPGAAEKVAMLVNDRIFLPVKELLLSVRAGTSAHHIGITTSFGGAGLPPPPPPPPEARRAAPPPPPPPRPVAPVIPRPTPPVPPPPVPPSSSFRTAPPLPPPPPSPQPRPVPTPPPTTRTEPPADDILSAKLSAPIHAPNTVSSSGNGYAVDPYREPIA